jgi:hypothetical protein
VRKGIKFGLNASFDNMWVWEEIWEKAGKSVVRKLVHTYRGRKSGTVQMPINVMRTNTDRDPSGYNAVVFL